MKLKSLMTSAAIVSMLATSAAYAAGPSGAVEDDEPTVPAGDPYAQTGSLAAGGTSGIAVAAGAAALVAIVASSGGDSSSSSSSSSSGVPTFGN